MAAFLLSVCLNPCHARSRREWSGAAIQVCPTLTPRHHGSSLVSIVGLEATTSVLTHLIPV